jgi:hypothetical protein
LCFDYLEVEMALAEPDGAEACMPSLPDVGFHRLTGQFANWNDPFSGEVRRHDASLLVLGRCGGFIDFVCCGSARADSSTGFAASIACSTHIFLVRFRHAAART